MLDVPLHGMLVRSDGVEHDLVLETPHLKTVRIFEFSGAIAAYGLRAQEVIGEPLVRDVRRAGAPQKTCRRPTRMLVHKRSQKRVADPEVRPFQLIGQRPSRGLAHFERSKHWRYAH